MNLAGAFRFSSSLVVVMDAGDGRIVDVNPAFEREVGYARAEVIGRRSVELDFWSSPETRATIWAHLRGEYRVCGERVVFKTRAGAERAAVLSCEAFEQDDAHYVLAIFQQVGEAGSGDHAKATDPGSYRALFNAAAEGLYRSLPDGGWIDVNPALARIFGYATPAQMLAETSGSRASSLYADLAHSARLRAILDARGQFENQRAQIHRRDGSLVWITENTRVVRDGEGRVLFYEGSVVDISEQIEAEARLRQSEALYKTLVENCRDGVFLALHERVLFANQTLADMLGCTAEELRQSHYMDFVAPESMAAQIARRDAQEDGSRSTQDYEVTVLRKDGVRRLMRMRAAAVEFNGEMASTGTIQDITDDRRQQQAIADAEHKYRTLFQNSVTGMFQSHPDGRLLQANDALARILGYADAPALMSGIAHMRQMYARSEDRERMIATLVRDGRVDGAVFMARQREGSEVAVEISAHTVFDSHGKVLYIEGSAQDITARRVAEKALQQSEARYRTLVEHSQVGVYLMLDDHYTYVNQAFAEMFGYEESELIGADFRVLVPTESIDQQENRYQQRRAGEPNIGGDYSVVLARKDGSRIEVVVSAGNVEMDGRQCTSGTIRDVTEQRRGQRQLEYNASHDLLTGLPNRLFFEQELAHTIAAAHASGSSDYAVLFLDLDGFKLVNDSLGHASGDLLLIQIAGSLRADFGQRVLVARYGGDEFTLLPQGACSRARAEQLAQRVLTLLGGSFEINGHRVFSGASLGVVLGHADYQTPDQVLRDADTAMYRAKASGKSAYVIFDEAMHAAARARLKIETDLRFALERGEFQIFYQPIVDLHTGGIDGCEALLRWQHPERGLLLPADFLDVASEAGLIVALDWWVLEQTCRNLLRWQRRYPGHAKLRASVNMDERQFGDRNLIETLRGVLKRTGIDPSTLALEITETIFRGGRTEAEATLNALKDLGVSLVVDDFGTGYSSLDSFATSPFDVLKVDRSFVRDMVTNPRHGAIVHTIAGFAELLGLGLIAEGVENRAQADLLFDVGCERGQGYLYSPPVSQEAFERMLEQGLPLSATQLKGAVA